RKMSLSRIKRFFRLFRFEDHLELAHIHGTAAGEDLADYSYASRMYHGWTQQDITPKTLISGEDLIALGCSPGPRCKELLRRVEELLVIPGISEKKWKAIRDKVEVQTKIRGQTYKSPN